MLNGVCAEAMPQARFHHPVSRSIIKVSMYSMEFQISLQILE